MAKTDDKTPFDRCIPGTHPPGWEHATMRLRAKYRSPTVAKSVRTKTSGNGGGVGHKARCKARGHSGGQATTEEMQRRKTQSLAAINQRTAWAGKVEPKAAKTEGAATA